MCLSDALFFLGKLIDAARELASCGREVHSKYYCAFVIDWVKDEPDCKMSQILGKMGLFKEHWFLELWQCRILPLQKCLLPSAKTCCIP